jgi:cytochrome c553
MNTSSAPVCRHCGNSMRLVRTIPAVGPAWPALLAFYCAECHHAETKEEERIEPASRIAAQQTAETHARRASDFR